MNLYKANSSNLRNFTLEKDDKTIGELIYKSWYSFKAEIALNNNQIYYFKPLGYFDPSIELFKEQTKIMSFKLGWKGVIIRVFNNGTETKFLLKKKMWDFGYDFILYNEEDEEMANYRSKFDWKKMHFDYKIEVIKDITAIDKNLFLLTSLHAVNYYIYMMNARMSAV